LIPEYKETPDGANHPGFFIAHTYFRSNELAVTPEYPHRLAEKQPPNEILATRP
jgi:hypothetical protein